MTTRPPPDNLQLRNAPSSICPSSMSLFFLSLLSTLPSLVAGHGGIWNYSIAGDWRPGYHHSPSPLSHLPLHAFFSVSQTRNNPTDNKPSFFPYYPAEGQSSIQRHWADFRPITNPTLPSLACNDPGTPAEEYATVAAGATIEAYYRGWPHDIGAIVVWMAYCGAEPTACASFNGTEGRRWFKIDQAGLLSGTVREGVWAQREMVARNYTWGVRVPERLRAGAYLIRHELIALHVPFTPEFYPECAHLWVVGGGGEVPGEEYMAAIPGVWESDGKGLGSFGHPMAPMAQMSRFCANR